MIDLSLVLLEDIWEELKKRHDSIIMAARNSVDGKVEDSFVYYKGGKFTCIGLAEHASDCIKYEARLAKEHQEEK